MKLKPWRRAIPGLVVLLVALGGLSLAQLRLPQPVQAQASNTTLRMLYWQGPTLLNPHLSTGTKDFEASRIVYEPLATFDKEGKMVPFLAAEVPTIENGGVARDLKSVTWKLKKDVKWADGRPFTADDVLFTYQFITNKEAGAVTTENYDAIEKIEAVDPLTVRITFKQPTTAWFLPFVGTNGMVLPKHVFERFNGRNSREAPANLAPIGTGPYTVKEFKPGDVIVYEANPNFRERGKPFFRRVELKGGGDAPSAARAVLQTGDADYGWNVQVEASILNQLEALGKGRVQPNEGAANVERIEINFSDPNKEVNGERSHKSTKHPFFSDIKVREAFTTALDRDTIAREIYGKAGVATINFIAAPLNIRSKTSRYTFDLKKAAALLDEAGWRDTNGNGTRDKGGVEMKVLFQTSVNAVRQKVQAIIKKDFESIGIGTELKSVDASIFFDSEPANNDNIGHFYADLQMYTTSNESPDPTAYLSRYICDQIAQKENNWARPNTSRYCNPEYDKLYNQLLKLTDARQRDQLIIQMNDFLVNKDFAVMPIINRTSPSAIANSIVGPDLTPWDLEPWNIKDWTRK